MQDTDLIIVGGGIAGGALATVMARAGASVILLERQSRYQDQVRGEILWCWGVQEARMLDLERVLVDSGALRVPWLDNYDEGAPTPVRENIGAVIPGIGGSLNLTHPAACAALAGAAAIAGAEVHSGVRNVRVSGGEVPVVRWLSRGAEQMARARLVVGADGRRSSIRSQAAIRFEVDPPAHLIAGMLVDEIDGIDRNVNIIARESDLQFFLLPQEGGRARLYFCFPADQRSRFAGRDGVKRFLRDSKVSCLNAVVAPERARPAGPCATFAGEDSRAPIPYADGVVLIGDAAGYENPVQGQGLSLALRDVRDVSAALLRPGWGWRRLEIFEDYAAARAVRQRLANIAVALEVWANDGFRVQDPEQRAARYDHIRSDAVLAALEASPFAGYDAVPQDLTHAEFVARLEAHR